jgi:phosphoserine phosphatase
MRLELEEYTGGTRVILVRHGQSSYNALGLYQGSSDESVLTEIGRVDARKTGDFLKELAFDAMYVSSLKRAQETAWEILGVMAPHIDRETILISEKLRETDMPAWQGLAFKFVKENFPEEYRLWKQHPDKFRMNLTPEGTGLESEEYIYPALNLYERVQEFWQQTLPLHAGKTLLLVTHGGTNRALISTALGIAPERYHCLQQSNCGISIVNFPDASLESGQLAAMNLSSHVGEYLPKPQEGGKGLRLLLIPANATAEETHNLAEFLKEIDIEFSLSGALGFSEVMLQQILQYHPETLQLQVLREEFPDIWQAAINRKTAENLGQLTTGLVIANEEIIKRIICHSIGMDLNQIERLYLKQGRINCIQYPGSQHPPILQAMNISVSGHWSVFNTNKKVDLVEKTKSTIA